MPPTRSYIERHHPLITPRIEFYIKSRPPLPRITARQSFNVIDRPSSSEEPVTHVEPPATVGSYEPPAGPYQPIGHSSQHTEPPYQPIEDSDQHIEPPHQPTMAATSDPSLDVHPQSQRQRLRFRSPTPTAGPSSHMIRKPVGEPGRPNSGGYSLQRALFDIGWSEGDYENLKKYLRVQVGKYLDSDLSYMYQDKQIIEEICARAMEPHNFPQLAHCQGCWPAHSALKAILKSTAESSRRAEGKNMTARMRELMQKK